MLDVFNAESPGLPNPSPAFHKRPGILRPVSKKGQLLILNEKISMHML